MVACVCIPFLPLSLCCCCVLLPSSFHVDTGTRDCCRLQVFPDLIKHQRMGSEVGFEIVEIRHARLFLLPSTTHVDKEQPTVHHLIWRVDSDHHVVTRASSGKESEVVVVDLRSRRLVQGAPKDQTNRTLVRGSLLPNEDRRKTP